MNDTTGTSTHTGCPTPSRRRIAFAPERYSAVGCMNEATTTLTRADFLPGYAPDLNPDELVWSHAKRTGVARSLLKTGEKLQYRVDEQLQNIANDDALVKSFFRHPSVSYIYDL